jgi:hypothetical protein
MRLSQNFSFGKATLILFEKADFRPLFRKTAKYGALCQDLFNNQPGY